MKSLLTIIAFFFLVGWLISFFKLQHGMASHLLLLISVILVMARLRYQGERKDKSSTA
jgi:hypothetical protein